MTIDNIGHLNLASINKNEIQYRRLTYFSRMLTFGLQFVLYLKILKSKISLAIFLLKILSVTFPYVKKRRF